MDARRRAAASARGSHGAQGARQSRPRSALVRSAWREPKDKDLGQRSADDGREASTPRWGSTAVHGLGRCSTARTRPTARRAGPRLLHRDIPTGAARDERLRGRSTSSAPTLSRIAASPRRSRMRAATGANERRLPCDEQLGDEATPARGPRGCGRPSATPIAGSKAVEARGGRCEPMLDDGCLPPPTMPADRRRSSCVRDRRGSRACADAALDGPACSRRPREHRARCTQAALLRSPAPTAIFTGDKLLHRRQRGRQRRRRSVRQARPATAHGQRMSRAPSAACGS